MEKAELGTLTRLASRQQLQIQIFREIVKKVRATRNPK